MKPRVFIGSSVEGLPIAYAIHNNLTHDCECIVWSQGAFEISKTAIESLEETTQSVDFAVFVFSPDDITKIRENTQSSIRDNVLFEYGLFTGALGRKRVFFVTPRSNDGMRIASDLLGLTGGTYEDDRQDENLIAATGAFAQDIRVAAKKHGLARPRAEKDAEVSNEEESESEKKVGWPAYFHNNEYKKCSAELEKLIQTKKDARDIEHLTAWKAYSDYKGGHLSALKELDTLAREAESRDVIPELVIYFYHEEELLSKASKLIEHLLETSEPDSEEHINALVSKSENQNLQFGAEAARRVIESTANFKENPHLVIELSRHMSTEDAFNLLVDGFALNQTEELAYAMQEKAQELKKHNIRIYLMDYLVSLNKESFVYSGYLSNVCLDLGMYDRAMFHCKDALKKANDREVWLKNNVANMLSNRGFYTDSISIFKEALEIDNHSQYGHERLSRALKKQTEEIKQYDNFIKEGRQELLSLMGD